MSCTDGVTGLGQLQIPLQNLSNKINWGLLTLTQCLDDECEEDETEEDHVELLEA